MLLCRFAVCLLVAVVSLAPRSLSAIELSELLPGDVEYDAKIPTPSAVLGFELGTRHITHAELVSYLQKLDAASPRIEMTEYGRSHGGRPLLLLTISAPANLVPKRLAEIRAARSLVRAPSAEERAKSGEHVVINMGYGVHGNEPSALNASVVVAYQLAAAKGKAIEKLLGQTIILLDPCLNPDGNDRFAAWSNNAKGRVPNPDPNHREHREAWPAGRTNYYWFDLNRDWFALAQPESQGRQTWYQDWLPQVVLDYHEMGTDSTYFFQPGVPSRMHPLAPPKNLALTRAIAQYHAAALDARGVTYFTEERFDDFFLGKGSTYPDFHGGIGILFEQASARGIVQDSVNGKVHFGAAIQNQVTTSLSSLAAVGDLHDALIQQQREFYADNYALARQEALAAYAFIVPGDPVRRQRLAALLAAHRVAGYLLSEDLGAGENRLPAGETIIVPVEQADYRFVKALVEERTKFADDTFYDTSSWTLPAAYGAETRLLLEMPPESHRGTPLAEVEFPAAEWHDDEGAVGYLIDGRDYFACRAAYAVLAAEGQVKVALEPFTLQVGDTERSFVAGSFFVPILPVRDKLDAIRQRLMTAAQDYGVRITPAWTSLSKRGIDLGSGLCAPLKLPKILLVGGEGVDAYEAGEVWHLLDERFEIPVTIVEPARVGDFDLTEYTAIVLVSGRYDAINPNGIEMLSAYLKHGGTLVAQGTALKFVREAKLATVEFVPELDAAGQTKSADRKVTAAGEAAAAAAQPVDVSERRPYAAADADAAHRAVPGTILRAEVDRTHPLGFGLTRSEIEVFRGETLFLAPSSNPYSTPLLLTAQPLASGFLSPENTARLARSASAVVYATGRGRVIGLADDLNFRGYWYGTNRIFLNAVLLGPIIRVPAP